MAAVPQINFSSCFHSLSFINRRNPPILSVYSPTTNTSRSTVVEPLSVTQTPTTNDWRENMIITDRPAGGKGEEEAVERAVRAVEQRAEAVVERITERETERMRERSARRGEALSSSERMSVEKMSREMVRKFLEKPIAYLRNGRGDMKEKLGELNFLLSVLEKS